MNDLKLRAEICEVGRRLWAKNLIGATEGNISVRLSSQRILCTPSGLSKGHMQPSDLVVIDNAGNPVGDGVPSSEIKLHLRILQDRKDCQAVIHAHPPIATAFTLAGEDIPDDVLPESMYVLGSVATVNFSLPGTHEVPDNLVPLIPDHKTFLLSHHGAATMGKDVWDALYRMETLERVAQMLMISKLLGKTIPMPPYAFDALMSKLNGSL
jgi:L-fuculose-phosphate aldolase